MRQEIVKFHDPLSQGDIILGKNFKIGYLFKNLLLYFQTYITQNGVYSDNDQGKVYPNCKFHEPLGKVIKIIY